MGNKLARTFAFFYTLLLHCLVFLVRRGGSGNSKQAANVQHPFSREEVCTLIEHLYSAHIHFFECSWRLADVLTCSQNVSNPEMRLVSAAIDASFPYEP
jgi:hypothetical protein